MSQTQTDQEVALWATRDGDLITYRNETWVFHEKPAGDTGLEAGDPVPKQLYKDRTHKNKAAESADLDGECPGM